MKMRSLLMMLLLALFAGSTATAQVAVTVGSKVTSEDGLVSGKGYLIKYTSMTGTPYIYDAGKTTPLQAPSTQNSPTTACVFYFISDGNGAYKLENAYTGNYWPAASGNARLYPTSASNAGSWAISISSGTATMTCTNGGTTYGLDRLTPDVVGWSSRKTVEIYEVTASDLSTAALSTFAGYDISVNSTAASNLSEGQWYAMFDRGANHGYLYEEISSHTLYNTNTVPSGSATSAAKYLVRLLNAGNNKYYLQTGYGNYFGEITESTAVPVTPIGSNAITIGKIADTDGHFYLQSAAGVVLDANATTNGDATVVGWGATVPANTGGNNDWAFYPIEFVESWVPTVSEVYTINNTNSDRGAMMYNGSSNYVWSSGKSGTFNAANANCQWVIIPTGTSGQYYLYNVGAAKFAVPSGTGSAASWIFSSDAVAVTFITQSDGTKKIKTATTDTYAAVSNGYAGPIINWNDVGGNFTITKVDGDQSTAANAAVAKLVDNQTAASAAIASGTDNWYVIRIKTHGTYADKFIYPAESEINYNGTYYPLTFDHGVNVRPAIDDVAYYFHIYNDNGSVYWQMPNGQYLYNNVNKFPVSTANATAINVEFVTNSGFRLWHKSTGSEQYTRYAVPYLLSSQYFIGETSSSGNAYYDIYPIDLAEAGLTAWQVIVEGLDASTQVTCTRSDVRGLSTVYTNGYFFLPTGSTPVNGDFTAEVSGSTITLPVTIDADAHTITTSLPALTINSPMAEATFTWNGESQTGKSVTFIYTGGTINDANITVSYTGNEYSSPTLSQTTWDGTASVTVTCTMTPAFFSTNFGDKWVRIASARNTSVVMGVTANNSVKQKALDYFDDGQLWCLVGNTSSFKIYNKKAGNTLQLASANTTIANGVTIAMSDVNAAGTDWQLGNAFDFSGAPGWNISYAGSSGFSLNVWSGAIVGNDIKYYQTPDVGDQWIIEDASGEVTLALTGLDTESMTTYTKNIADLPVTIVGSSSKTLLTKDNFVTRTAYVPNNSELTFGTPAMFMNYGFTGYDGTAQTKTVTATTTPQTVTATFSVVRPDARYLWEALSINNTDCYRIPAIVTAKNGDVLAICDRRFANSDSDLGGDHHIDIIGVASSDNGNTWGNEFMVMDGNNGSNTEVGYGDAAVVADRERNEVLVMACGGNVSYQSSTSSHHQVVVRTVLTHDGSTWQENGIDDKTTQFYSGDLASCDGLFIGSGSITQSSIIKKGDYYRVYCAILARNSKNYVLYSDDFGATWTYLDSSSPAAQGDEAKVAELPDGSVLLSVRKGYTGRIFNVWRWSDDTYTTGSWSTAVNTNQQTNGLSNSDSSNGTNGDIRMIPAKRISDGTDVILAMQSSPNGGSRSHVSIFYKVLDPNGSFTNPVAVAQDWSSAFEVTPHSSAYSSFNLQPDGRIAFYMEEAPKSITGYYMCYVPLTLDEITNGQYTGIPATYTVNLNAVDGKSYATLYLPFDVTTDADTKAFYASAAGNGKVTLVDLNGNIPARTAVVLVNSAAATGTTFDVTSGLSSVVTESDNWLKGTLVDMSLDLSDGTPYYSLGVKDNKVGFYKYDNNGTTSITLGANKAYLEVSGGSSSKGFVFSFDETNSINEELRMKDEESGTVVYDLSGRKVMSTLPDYQTTRLLKKGIYIMNGKKVVIK